MDAVVISVGTELTSGEIVDTNAAYLSRELAAIGISAVRHVTVGDDEQALAGVLVDAASVAPLVIVTGGIGPTPDDLTRQAAARAAGVPLVRNEAALAHIQEMFSAWGRQMSPNNAVQADFPEGSNVVPNPRGTAAGFRITIRDAEIIVLPGVPAEMKLMWAATVRNHLASRGAGVTLVRTVNCFGEGESTITEKLRDLMRAGANPSVGDTAEESIIKIRIRAAAPTAQEALRLIDPIKAQVAARLGLTAFGEDSDTLESVVVKALLAGGLTVAVAESCTGGLLAKRLTDVPGASGCFTRGIVAYHNDAKRELLGVPADLIAEQGAVSEAVAAAMAEGVRSAAGADFGIGITGIAGPTGGSPLKPVGLVYVALAGRDGTDTKVLQLRGNRFDVRDRASKHALNILRLALSSG